MIVKLKKSTYLYIITYIRIILIATSLASTGYTRETNTIALYGAVGLSHPGHITGSAYYKYREFYFQV